MKPPMPDAPAVQMLTVAQAAASLGLTQVAVRQAIRRRTLDGAVWDADARRWRIPAGSVEQYRLEHLQAGKEAQK